VTKERFPLTVRPPAHLNSVLTVCALAHHSLALQQLRRLLADAGMQVEVRRMDVDVSPDRAVLELPKTHAYVLDTDRAHPAATRLAVALLHRNPAARVLAVAEDFSQAQVFELLRLGTRGVLRYAQMDGQLGPAVTAVAAGGIWVPREVLAQFIDSLRLNLRNPPANTEPGKLSRRELEVRDALMDNLSNKEIANKLHISERTAKFHVSNLLAKFGVRRRADLIVQVFQTRRG